MRASMLAAAMLCVAAVLARAAGLPPSQSLVASYYGAESGPRTASGERFDPEAMTAACCGPGYRTLPFGTLVRVTFRGRAVVVRVNDRGPSVRGRYIDISEGAARRVGLVAAGVGSVQIEVLGAAPYRPKAGDWGAF